MSISCNDASENNLLNKNSILCCAEIAVVCVHASGVLSVCLSVCLCGNAFNTAVDSSNARHSSISTFQSCSPQEHLSSASSKQASKQNTKNVCLGTFTIHYHFITKPLLKSASSLISLRCWSVAHANVCPTPSLRFYFMSERCCLAGRLDHQHWVHSRRDGLRTHGCICCHQVGSQRLESQLL